MQRWAWSKIPAILESHYLDIQSLIRLRAAWGPLKSEGSKLCVYGTKKKNATLQHL